MKKRINGTDRRPSTIRHVRLIDKRPGGAPSRPLRLRDLPPVPRRRIQALLECPEPCLLCGGPARHVGMFVPHVPAEWGAPEDHEIGAFYCLCIECLERPGYLAEVEALLWQERQMAVSARWN